MHTDALSAPNGLRLRLAAGTAGALVVVPAMLASTIVFSEPAIADMLMMGVILALPIIGVMRPGRAALSGLTAWLVIVALGLAATSASTNMDTAITHQLVTLFLAAGAFVLAAYIAKDPEPRFRLIMMCYTAACLAATAAAFVGYFQVIPSAYDLFTNFGRARGTFKDPNVYGAAMAPAILFAFWVMLREKSLRALIAAGAALVLLVGVLISFSRGAWISTGVSLFALAWITLVRSRRRTDFGRFANVAILGTLGLVLALGAVLKSDAVEKLFEERANLDQSYDSGPDGRFGGQAKAVDLILEHPFGIGTHSFRDTYHPEEAHNVYLTTFLNAGWLGGLLYIAVVVATLVVGIRCSAHNGALQGAFLISTAAFAGLAVEGFVVDTDHWRHFFLMMACIWGLADAAPPLIDPSRRRDD
jgi:O-antigen ligase